MNYRLKLLWTGMCAIAFTLCLAPPANGAGTSSSDTLLRWYQTKTVAAYKKSKYTNAVWNDPAEKALEMYSQIAALPSANTASNWTKMTGHLKSALDAGCNDPFLRYLELQYLPSIKEQTPDKVIAAWVKVAERLDSSRHYTTTLKFNALLRLWNVWVGYNTDPNHPPPQYGDALKSYHRAHGYVKKIITDTNTPPQIAYETCSSILRLFQHDKGNGLKEFYDGVKNDLARRYSEDAHVSLLRGQFYIDYGWQARGYGWGNTVSEDGARLLSERLLIAEEALEKAWRLDPTIEAIPLEMMRAILGLGRDRARQELWFQRAMSINSNNFQACRSMIEYLSPRWHGSATADLEFARRCVASAEWGGKVPLILFEAHWLRASLLPNPEARAAYWRQPAVWPDVKQSFEKCFLTMPEQTDHNRHNYILYADACGQWPEMHRQLRLLTSTNVNFFGGAIAFQKMLERGGNSTNRPPADVK